VYVNEIRTKQTKKINAHKSLWHTTTKNSYTTLTLESLTQPGNVENSDYTID